MNRPSPLLRMAAKTAFIAGSTFSADSSPPSRENSAPTNAGKGLVVVRLDPFYVEIPDRTVAAYQLEGMYRIVIYAQDPFRAVDDRGIVFGPVICPAGGHRPDHAVLHPEDAQGVVVDRDGIPVRTGLVQCGEQGSHVRNPAVQQIIYQIDLVHPEVGHHAHRGLLLAEEPGAFPGIDAPGLGTGVTEGGPEGQHLSYRSGGYHLACLAVDRGEPLVLGYEQKPAGFPGRIHHSLAFFECRRHRFLAKDVLAGLQGFDRHLCVGGVGKGDHHGVHGSVCKHLVDAVIDAAAVGLGHLFRPRAGGVVVSCDFGLGMRAEFGYMPHLCNLSAADDSDSFFHSVR